MKNLQKIFIFLLSTTTIQAQAAALGSTAILRGSDVILDLVRVSLTNIAISKYTDNPQSAASLHAGAAMAGIARDLVVAQRLFSNEDIKTTATHYALGSPLTTHLLDAAIHLKNKNNINAYCQLSNAELTGIRTAQVLAILTNCLANYVTSDFYRIKNIQINMQNIHTALQSLEKLLQASSYEPALVNKKIEQTIHVMNAIFNAIFSISIVDRPRVRRGRATAPAPVVVVPVEDRAGGAVPIIEEERVVNNHPVIERLLELLHNDRDHDDVDLLPGEDGEEDDALEAALRRSAEEIEDDDDLRLLEALDQPAEEHREADRRQAAAARALREQQDREYEAALAADRARIEELERIANACRENARREAVQRQAQEEANRAAEQERRQDELDTFLGIREEAENTPEARRRRNAEARAARLAKFTAAKNPGE